MLVNNAGYGLYGALEDRAHRGGPAPIRGERLRPGASHSTGASADAGATRRLRSSTSPRWAARSGSRSGSWYHASKFAVEGLSDSLRVEVAAFGIKVVIIQPGTIRSEWSGIAADKLEATSTNTPYAAQARLVGGGLRAVDQMRMASGPEVVAEAVAKAVQSPKPRTRYVVGGGARGILLAEAVLPDRGFDRFIQLGYRMASR